MLYGQKIKWTRCDGSPAAIFVGWFKTQEEARVAVIKAARRAGWTPPRWWQWWRRKDSRP